ncbi:MAG: hypothetical protein ABIH46_13395 [Chloroflexota bacterium]
MNVSIAEYAGRQSVTEEKRSTNKVIMFLRKLVKTSIMDGDAIFKSKDWPCLWSK